MENIATQNWEDDINREKSRSGGGNKLRLYRTLKTGRDTETFLQANISRRQRSALSRFRAGVPLLNIEFGRYCNIPVDRRFCVRCHNDVEDELHALIRCPLYKDIRKSLFEYILIYVPNFMELDDNDKLVIVLSDGRVARAAARACSQIIEERKKYVFK